MNFMRLEKQACVLLKTGPHWSTDPLNTKCAPSSQPNQQIKTFLECFNLLSHR